MVAPLPLIVDFSQVDKTDISLVGGKGANLGEMIRAGFPVPAGFIITSQAYWYLLEVNQLRPKIASLLKSLNPDDPDHLNQLSKRIKQLILEAKVPDDLSLVIIKRYLKLNRGLQQVRVAVRSSATAEDLPDASFAGQQETFLNVQGEANLIQAVRGCWASLFEPRAMFYRITKGFDHFSIGIAVPVQMMVQSEISGVMFTVNPVTNNKNQIVIEAIYGLGEKIVQGAYTPDHYLVQKLSWQILQKQLNRQSKQLIWSQGKNREIRLAKSKQNQAKLSDDQIIELAKLGQKIQQHYFFPQDIEWAYLSKRFYLVQSRPVTTLQAPATASPSLDTKKLKLLLKGDPASPGLATGYVRVLASAREINKLKPQEILVTSMTTPDFVPAMKKAAAIVTDKGGQTSHAAIVSRELGIPCVVGTQTATKKLKPGQVVTVNGLSGEIYLGGLTLSKKTFTLPVRPKPKPLTKKEFQPTTLVTATKIYVNLAEPDLAQSISQKNVDGVGLLRAEFMIAQMGIHPKKLIRDQRQTQFVDGLTSGLKSFCQAFYPRPVVYRATDFKTNEYAHLIGGKEFEPIEPNPMLGFRGAYRYLNDPQVFKLELEAITQVRNKLGFKNLWLMIPFVRSVSELTQVKKIISDQGLIRSPSFKLWLMAEIPVNVVQLEDFIRVGIDGVSIGSNDLTMLMLGVDRDNAEVAPIFDEQHPAVLWALKKTITTCRRHRITSSICGQAPSTYPELTEKLVRWGITSISVSPDAIETTREIVYQAERKVVHGQNRQRPGS